MANGLTKVFLVYLSINLLLYVGGVRVVGDDNSDFVSQFINETSYNEGAIDLSDGLTDTMPTTLEQSGTNFLDFIDALGAVKRFVFFVVNIVFTPLGLFVSAGMPQAVTLLVGMPLMVSLMLGIAYFIRSGS